MPKKDEFIQFNSKTELLTPQQKLALKLFNEFKKEYVKSAAKYQDDPIAHTRMSIVALSQLAAILAVDVGMQPDQFLNVNRCNFEEAFKVAPRFG